MTLLDRVQQRATAVRSRPRASADPVTLEEFGVLLGQSSGTHVRSKAGPTISDMRALAVPAWYSGVRHISEVCAGLPAHRYAGVGSSRRQIAKPPWMMKPDVEQTWYGLVEFWLMSLLHRGNAYAFKLRNPLGQVVGLRELSPGRVTPGQAPDGTKRFLIDHDEREWTTRDVLHIPGLAYNGRVGLNPIRVFAEGLGNVVAAEEYASRFFSNGTNLGGIISVPQELKKADAERLREEWDEFHQGLLNAHRTGVLSKGATYSRLALTAEDTQLLETRRWGVITVAQMLRLPPHKLYELSRATFSNIEHQSIESVTDGIQPWCERIEAWINADTDLTTTGTYMKLELDGRQRGDTKTRYEGYAKSVGGPWQTINEARAYEDLPPVDGGDELLRPLNMGGDAQEETTDEPTDQPG